jgi:phosphate transport system substrate-binding protein
MMRPLAALLFALLSLVAARAAEVILPVVPAPSANGVIRVWGNAALAPVIARWQLSFNKKFPAARIEPHLTGSDVAMSALATGTADLALLGREPTAAEVKAFEWVYRWRPARIDLLTGSLAAPGQSPALVVFVHRDNPLAGLTLAQLDALFCVERLRGAPARLATWGQLGLGGDWAARPIRLLAPDTESGTGRFFRAAALGDSRKLHWDALREFSDTPGAHPAHDASQKILAALAADPLGLAVASLPAATDGLAVKPIALDGVAATRETVAARTYPLARPVLALVNRAPGQPLDPLLRDFLSHALGAEPQREAALASGYLQLSAELAREQLKTRE